MEREKLSASEVDSLLNKRSGLLGISEGSNDMREIIEAMDRGSERHALAFRMFCGRVRKYIGAYATVLGGLDAVVFTGGIGENAARVRAEILHGLEFLGLVLDAKSNDRNGTRLSTGPTQALVIPTNEELAIARDTCEVLARAAAETEGALSGEAIEAELLRVSNQDRRELVMLWAADPQADPEQLRDRLVHKVGKKLSLQALRCELGRLGLVDVPEEECAPAPPVRATARRRTKTGAARKAG
jgi:acetate kinase